jgi:hypothetical protein
MAGARGEGYLELDGETFAVLFTNRALAEAERALGKSVVQIANAFGRDAIGVGDVAQLLTVGLEHARRDSRSRPQSYTINDAWDLLDKLGFAVVVEAVMLAIVQVISYRPTKDKDGETANPPV